MIAKTHLSWPAPDSSSIAPIELLHEPAARQALDHVLAVQMQLELATGVPVAIYGPTGQTLPGISPIKSRQAEQPTPPIKEILPPQNWPQSTGQMLEVIYGSNLHLFITPFIIDSVPIAQVILGPLRLFEPGGDTLHGRADAATQEHANNSAPVDSVPVLASWKAQAVAELARTLISKLSMSGADQGARLSPLAQLLPLNDRETTAIPVPGHALSRQQGTAPRLRALAQDALLAGRTATARSQRIIESIQMLHTPSGDHNTTPARPVPSRPLSADDYQTESQPETVSRLRDVIEAMPQAVIVSAAPDGRIVLANHAARERWPLLLGSKPGNQNSSPLQYCVSADEYPPEWLGLRVALRQGSSFRGEVCVENPESDRAKQPMLLSAFPLHTAQGVASHAVAIFEDLSGLLEREHFKDELLLAAAHDMRNPLTLISSQAQLLERSLAMELHAGQGLERARERLAEIHQQVYLLTKLSSQLSTMTRLQSAEPRPYTETVNLARLLQRAVIDQQILTPERTIETVIAHDRCLVPGNQTQLQQIMMHLLKNAVKYSHPGKPIRVSLRCTPANTPLWAEISVRDQGIGVPRTSLPHLFERFYRVSNHEHRARLAGIRPAGSETASLGLNLYLCKRLIERMGGNIWAESVEGQGTIISFRLPLHQ